MGVENKFLKNYGNSLILISGLLVGSILGWIFGTRMLAFKVLGDIFLNLLFFCVVPLIFFTITSSIAGIEISGKKAGKLTIIIFSVFIFTLILMAVIAICTIKIFPLPSPGMVKGSLQPQTTAGWSDQLTQLLTVDDFYTLFSRNHIMALILASFLIGLSIRNAGDNGTYFKKFIESGQVVMTHFLNLIMKFAPFGLGAYMACQVASLGPKMFGIYGKAILIYHGVGLVYILGFFSILSFLWGGRKMIMRYWKNVIPSMAVALGTCSSIASIPSNLEVTQRLGIPRYIRNLVMPIGGVLHKDGSSLSFIIKIATVFAMLNRPFSGLDTYVIAIMLTVIISMVEGGVPNGGYLGEILFVSLYHLPAESLTVAMAIGTLVDPFATLLNVTANSASCMLISRIAGAHPDAES